MAPANWPANRPDRCYSSHADPFSFTNAGKPLDAHEWVTELFFYCLYRLGSYSLLVIVCSLIITGLFLLAYVRSTKTSRQFIFGFPLFTGAPATVPIGGVCVNNFPFDHQLVFYIQAGN